MRYACAGPMGFCRRIPSVRMRESVKSLEAAPPVGMNTKSNIIPFDEMPGVDGELI